MRKPIRIILADDHRMFREAIGQLLKMQEDIQVVAEAADGQELVALVQQWRPDIVFADINMPVMDGIEATRLIKKQFPSTGVIALTMLDNSSTIDEMLEAGANGYLLKNASGADLRRAIETFLAGELYLCTQTAKKLHQQQRNLQPIKEKTNFSDKQIEILKLICKGYNNMQIADKLCLSRRTIEGHRERMRLNSGSHNMAGVIAYGLKNGLLD